MLRQNYDFSSVHIEVPCPLSDEIIKWGKEHLPDEDVFMYEGTLGREDEIHITVLYGIHSESSQQTRELLRKTKSLSIKLGRVKLFSNNDRFDVVYVEAENESLYDMNRRFKNHIKYTNRYPKYEPHVTIAYVKKGKGLEHYGKYCFVGKSFVCDHVIFSSKNGAKENIPLIT
jgi:2'-5' RNA ligase